ncbi:hypothetical protein HDU91_006951 [Kappamyces sp. JEL0680]|nr:hypothetical protein HDU91_006951 [Kappamyces sp. JEL0680]
MSTKQLLFTLNRLLCAQETDRVGRIARRVATVKGQLRGYLETERRIDTRELVDVVKQGGHGTAVWDAGFFLCILELLHNIAMLQLVLARLSSVFRVEPFCEYLSVSLHTASLVKLDLSENHSLSDSDIALILSTLARQDRGSLGHLGLQSLCMASESLDALEGFLRRCPVLKHLDLSRNRSLRNELVYRLHDVLLESTSLQYLSLKDTGLNDDALVSLSSLVVRSRSLVHISLGDNAFLGSGMEAFASSIARSRLASLDFSGGSGRFSPENIRAMEHLVDKAVWLRRLDLRISPRYEMKSILERLGKNTTLAWFDCWDCEYFGNCIKWNRGLVGGYQEHLQPYKAIYEYNTGLLQDMDVIAVQLIRVARLLRLCGWMLPYELAEMILTKVSMDEFRADLSVICQFLLRAAGVEKSRDLADSCYGFDSSIGRLSKDLVSSAVSQVH